MAAPDVSSRPLGELISLEGKVAVVTGAARGIGQAVARRLAEAGAKVLLGDLDKGAVEEAAAEIGSNGTAVGAQLDVTDTASVRDAVDRASAELGPIDILVNNAGVFPILPALATPDEEWAHVLRTNIDGAFICSREVAGRMAAADHGGVIVNITSTEAFKVGAPGLSAYVTSKHGLSGLTKALALELGPVGIRVLGVAPTICSTPGLEEKMPIFEAAGMGGVIEQTAAALPLGRVAVPDDVARAVLFCASDMAALMTGSTLLVDAGAMLL